MKKVINYENMEPIDIGSFMFSPVILGNNDEYIWTGMLSPEDVDDFLITGPKQLEFKKLVAGYERAVKGIRRILNSYSDSVLQSDYEDRIINEFKSQLVEREQKLKSFLNKNSALMDKDVLGIRLCRKYELIKEKNPEELKYLDPMAKREILRVYENLKNRDFFSESYNEKTNRYELKVFQTRSREVEFDREVKENLEKFKRVIQAITGKEDVDEDEEFEILTELTMPMTIVDYSDMFTSLDFKKQEYILMLKNYLLKKGYTDEQISEMDYPDIFEKSEETYGLESMEFYAVFLSEMIANNMDTINVERFLLLYMNRALDSFELVKTPESLAKEAKEAKDAKPGEIVEIPDNVKKTGKDSDKNGDVGSEFKYREEVINAVLSKSKRAHFIINKILESGVVTSKTKFYSTLEKNTEYSLKNALARMKIFCDGYYLNELIKSNLTYKAFMMPEEMSSWSDELLQRMELNEEDIEILSLINFENLTRFAKMGKVDEFAIGKMLYNFGSEERTQKHIEEVDDIIENDRREFMIRNSKLLLKNLVVNKVITADDLRDYFESYIIDSKVIFAAAEHLEEGEKEEFDTVVKEAFDQQMLLESYRSYTEKYNEFMEYQEKNPEDTEKIEELRTELNKLRDYKEDVKAVYLKYNPVKEEEKSEFGNELLDLYFIEMNVEDEKVLKESIKLLYEDGLIGLENISYFDPEYILPMFDKLSLKDAEKIKSSMSFDKLAEMFDLIFEDQSYTDERRFIAVMNFFGDDTEEDKVAREYYLDMIANDGKETKSRGTSGIGGVRNSGNVKLAAGNRYVYPDYVKWKFYKTLDKDVRVTRYKNGFVEFASTKLDSRILEQYYKGNKPAYGTATYILTEGNYKAHQGDLITVGSMGDILESSVLRTITPTKDRVTHRTHSDDRSWMQDMIKYFGIDLDRMQDSRYSKEELEELKTVIDRYKKEYDRI